MEKLLQPVKVLSDGDGHWYIVPSSIADQFHSMLQDCENADDYEPFEVTFSRYRTGGDVNNVQLYAEI